MEIGCWLLVVGDWGAVSDQRPFDRSPATAQHKPITNNQSLLSMVLEDHLDRLSWARVQEGERLARGGERKAVRDEATGTHFPQQLQGEVKTARFRPAPGEPGMDRANLAGDQRNPATVKATAQVEVGALCAIPGPNHDPPCETGERDRLIQGTRVPGQLVAQVAAAAEE